MKLRSIACALAVLLAGCRGGPGAGRAPTTEVQHPLSAQARLNDHAARLADGVARYREMHPGSLPGSLRDLSLTMAADGRPCFSEILKDQWFQPYAYAPVDPSSGTFSLASAGPNGIFGDGDDLRTVRGPGDARTETYGYTQHPNE